MSLIMASTILDFPCIFSSEAAYKLDRVSMSFYTSVNTYQQNEFKQILKNKIFRISNIVPNYFRIRNLKK